MANIVVLDAGNSIIKAKSATGEIAFPHAIKHMTATAYEQVMMRAGERQDDYLLINGVPYAIGSRAFGEGFAGRQHGSARYTREYYGIFVAAALYKLYDKSMRNIVLYASHAPQDISFRNDLKEAARGAWVVESGGEERVFQVHDVRCYDEPVGGLMNVVLNATGTGYQRTDLRRGRVLVFDIGGHTTDVVIMKDGKVDYDSADSDEHGIISVEKEFVRELVSHYRDIFKKANAPAPDRVREGIRTGSYAAGGYGAIECEGIADRAASNLVSKIYDLFINYGGITGNEYLLLTGGGSALLERRLKQALGHPNTVMAERAGDMHLANIRGGMKMMRFYETMGMLNDA